MQFKLEALRDFRRMRTFPGMLPDPPGGKLDKPERRRVPKGRAEDSLAYLKKGFATGWRQSKGKDKVRDKLIEKVENGGSNVPETPSQN